MPQVPSIKEDLSILLELASDGNCSLFSKLASAKIDPWNSDVLVLEKFVYGLAVAKATEQQHCKDWQGHDASHRYFDGLNSILHVFI